MAKILIIDDDPGIGALVEAMLRKHKHEVLSATNGIEGISIAETQQPDLILLDVLMPQIGGVKILRHLRNDERTAHIPILVVTAAGGDILDMVEALGEAGPDLLMTKPFRAEELLDKMQSLLDQ